MTNQRAIKAMSWRHSTLKSASIYLKRTLIATAVAGIFPMTAVAASLDGAAAVDFNTQTAIGINADVSAPTSTIFTGRNGVAIGSGDLNVAGYDPNLDSVDDNTSAQALGDNAVSIGHRSYAGNDFATSVGPNSAAVGYASAAFGTTSRAYGDASLAVGQSVAYGNEATAVGVGNTVFGQNSTALGSFATVNRDSDRSIAIGAGTSPLSAAIVGDVNFGMSTVFTTDGIAIGSDVRVVGGAHRSIAMGTGARALFMDAVAIGSGSIADEANTFSVGSSTNLRRITHVADGTEATDAATFGQVTAVATRVTTAETNITNLQAYDTKVEEHLHLNNATITPGAVNTVTAGEGASAGGSNTVTLGTGAKTQAAGAVAIGNNAKAVTSNSVAIGNGAVAQSSVAVGTGAQALGTNTTAVGDNAVANGSLSTAIGNNAQTTLAATNSVALGNGSIADQANTVSIGSAGNERRITNVAAGTAPTDAVNYQQLQDAVAGSGGRLDRVADSAYRGTAIAMATTPNPIVLKPGQYSITTGYGYYRRQSGLGLNVSRFSEDGHSAINLGIGYSPQGGGAAVRGSMSYVLGGD